MTRDWVLCVTVGCATLGVSNASGQAYRITKIGGPEVVAHAINGAGQVTGSLATPSSTHAFLYSGGVMTDLGTIPGYDAVGLGINDAGEIVGNLKVRQGTGGLGFLYSSGVMTVLPTLDVGTSWCCSGSATAINNSGQVAGTSGARSQPGSVAVIYTNGVPKALPLAPSSWVYGLNDYGQATGYDAATGYGFVYSDGAVTHLFSIAPNQCLRPPCSSSGEAMNNAAQVAGNYQIPDFDPPNQISTAAFLYANGAAQVLPTFASPVPLTATIAEALAINNAAQVVGRSGERGVVNNQHAFLYSGTDGAMLDLNRQIDPTDPLASSITLNGATAINDNGWLVAISYYPPPTGTYLLTPVVPYPSAVQVTAFPASAILGFPFTVAWTDQSVTACTASGGHSGDGWGGSVAINGGNQQVIEATAGAYSFTIECTGASGRVTSTASVTVDVPPSVTLQATPSTVTTGQRITLTWNSVTVTACTGSGGSTTDSWNGSQPVSGTLPTAEANPGTYTYAITCTYGAQTVRAQAVVVVSKLTPSGGGALDLWSVLVLIVVGAVRRSTPLAWNALHARASMG